MWKLFQSIVWILAMWAAVIVQDQVDVLATFIVGGLWAFLATQLVVLVGMAASRIAAGFRRAFRRLLLFKHPQQPTRRLVAQQRRLFLE